MYEKANIERTGLLHEATPSKNCLQILMSKNYTKNDPEKWFTLGFVPNWL